VSELRELEHRYRKSRRRCAECDKRELREKACVDCSTFQTQLKIVGKILKIKYGG